MKHLPRILAIYGLILITAVFMGCWEDGKDGAEGPMGPVGAAGKDGKDGEAKCQVCHNDSSAMLAKILQYRNSIHAEGKNSGRSDAACARCHTNEGFIRFVKTGIDTFSGGVANPTPQNCRTCHMIHTNFDTTDFRQRVQGPVDIRTAGQSHDFGKGGGCATCHQPRSAPPKLADDSVKVTSSRYGPHYGAQAVILSGKGAYQYEGSTEYANSEHTKRAKDACVECHMGRPFGQVAGGHTLKLEYGDPGRETALVTGCATCHTDGNVKDFNYKNVQDTVKMLMDSLKVLLVRKKIMNDSTELAKTGTYPAAVAGAFYNFKLIYADHSGGNHNYPYTKALLLNSIEALNK